MASTADAEIRENLLYREVRRDLLCSRYSSEHPFKLNEMCVADRVSGSVMREPSTRPAAQGPVMSKANEGPRFSHDKDCQYRARADQTPEDRCAAARVS